MSRLLLAEDDQLVGTMVSMNLESEGYEVRWVQDGASALELARAEHFDLVLLDIGLPVMDGMVVLHGIRSAGTGTPVLMLTARGDVPTKVSALDGGADDYLTKPFDVDEMLARVRALVRRSQADREIPSSRLIRFGEYKIDLDTREATTNQGVLQLGEKEAELVALLVRSAGRPLTRADILDEVWGMDATPTERTVDNYLLRLRKLFEPDPASPRHILTVRGTGYRFVP